MAKDANNEVKNKKTFFKDFKAELKKVIWPTPKQIVNSTIAVITIVIITAVIVFVLDLVFDIISNKGINKIKENLKGNTVLEQTVDTDGTEETEQNNEENTSAQNTQKNEISEANTVNQ